MINSIGYAAQSATTPLGLFNFERREPGPHDVQIEILYCGVCHSDLHTVYNEWKNTVYPIVPGHEIVGRVVKIGEQVTKFQVGEVAGVGCMVDSCRTCPNCRASFEQYCDNEIIFTYNSPEKQTGKMTYGGYSNQIVVDENYVLHVSQKLDLAAVAPLLCAGITTYSPLRYWKVGRGDKVGIVGLGGLGHMALKFAHAFGAYTVLFTTSSDKTKDAKRLGADEFVISKNNNEMSKHINSFDFILDTISVSHNLDAYTQLLKRSGTLCLLGVPEYPHSSPDINNLINKRLSIAGSMIGGIKETQEMLDFCAQHNIVCDIELIPIQKINQAYERMLKSEVKYRFVIDIASLGQEYNTTKTLIEG
ncbi:NAD(P)-dependent alcohol dehydrogenase [Nostoc sp. CHAB 5844]|nr:NAD(P)-dependent alcohol dehydrogenase [Nostoc sp. CHAB 5844]